MYASVRNFNILYIRAFKTGFLFLTSFYQYIHDGFTLSGYYDRSVFFNNPCFFLRNFFQCCPQKSHMVIINIDNCCNLRNFNYIGCIITTAHADFQHHKITPVFIKI